MTYKVCHLTTVHTVFDVRIFHKMCVSLAYAGYDVFLVATHEKNVVIKGIKIRKIPKVENRLFRMIFKPFMTLWVALKIKADLYHFHDPELIPVGLMLKIFGKRVIYDVHEDLPNDILGKYWIPKTLRSFIASIANKVEKYSSKFFDAIITATPYLKENFKDYNSFTVDINNYPILFPYQPMLETFKKENTICYIGSISRNRGIEELLKAIEKTSIKLILAGKFESYQYQEIVKKIPAWNTKVDYRGFVSHNKCIEIMKESLLGIILLHPTPCYIKSIPVKMFEYAEAGIPILASDFLYWKEILNGINCAEFVNPFSSNKIRMKLIEVIKNPRKLREMGKEGRKAVLSNFNWKKEEKKLINVYRHILKKGLK